MCVIECETRHDESRHVKTDEGEVTLQDLFNALESPGLKNEE